MKIPENVIHNCLDPTARYPNKESSDKETEIQWNNQKIILVASLSVRLNKFPSNNESSLDSDSTSPNRPQSSYLTVAEAYMSSRFTYHYLVFF